MWGSHADPDYHEVSIVEWENYSIGRDIRKETMLVCEWSVSPCVRAWHDPYFGEKQGSLCVNVNVVEAAD